MKGIRGSPDTMNAQWWFFDSVLAAFQNNHLCNSFRLFWVNQYPLLNPGKDSGNDYALKPSHPFVYQKGRIDKSRSSSEAR
ncbi:hypothetical protein D3C87_1652920 [compost metagenome]